MISPVNLCLGKHFYNIYVANSLKSIYTYFLWLNLQKTTLLLIIAMLAWGSVYPVSKYLMTDLKPMVLGFLRYFTAVLTLTPFFIVEIRKNSNKIDLKSFFILTAAGLAGTAVFAVFLFSGVKLSTASNGSIIINTQPVFTAVLAPLLIREKISTVQLIGILVGFAGMFLVVTGGHFSSFDTGNEKLAGNLLLVCGAVSMSLYGILIKAPVKKFGGLISTWISMTIGTLLLFIINLFTVDNFFASASSPAGSDLLLILYLGSVATALAYLLFSMSLKHLNVLIATSFKFLIPVSGVGLSIIFLGEKPAVAVYGGILIVILSVFLIQHGFKPSEATGKAGT